MTSLSDTEPAIVTAMRAIRDSEMLFVRRPAQLRMTETTLKGLASSVPTEVWRPAPDSVNALMGIPITLDDRVPAGTIYLVNRDVITVVEFPESIFARDSGEVNQATRSLRDAILDALRIPQLVDLLNRILTRKAPK